MSLGVAVRVQMIERSASGPVRCRCRIPFAFNAAMGLRAIRKGGAASRAMGEGEGEGEGDGAEVIEGPASSTSFDWYGTHMSPTALESMARQFVAGVDYFPRHHSWIRSIEWDEVIGQTIGAEIRRETVADLPEGAESLVLYVRTKLDLSVELAERLVSRIEKGWAVGQSIGGWFTEVAVTYDEDGWATDVEVMDVELDHLAAVRSPANPDADRLWLATSRALVEAGGDSRARRELRSRAGSGLLVQQLGTEVVVSFPEASSEASDEARSTGGAVAQPVSLTVPEEAPLQDGQRSAPEDSTMPMTPEEIAALASAIGEQMRGAVAPLALKIDQLGASAPAAPAPASAPATPPTDPLAEARARADLAEAELRTAKAQAEALRLQVDAGVTGGRSAVRSAGQPGPATPATPAESVNGIRERVPGPGGVDLREICPRAIRAVGASYGQLSLTPSMIFEVDGAKALAQYAKAEGSAPTLAELALGNDLLTSTRKGAVRALAASCGPMAKMTASSDVEGGWSERGTLEDLLFDVIRAGVDDGLIAQKSQYAAWA